MEKFLNGNQRDPAMLYEYLARYAFDSARLEDPHEIASASHYDFVFVPEVKPEGVESLKLILEALIKKSDDKEKTVEFMDLHESLTNEGMKQRNAIDLMQLIISIINDED